MGMTAEYARAAFDYDGETGIIRWKNRPREHFKNTHGWRIANGRFAGTVAGSIDRKGYIRIAIDGCVVRAHRLIWLWVYGQEPLGEVDHINGDRSDNRLENLRVVTSWENARNKRTPRTNTSGRIGVSWRGDLGKWSATIGADHKSFALGIFDTKEEAVAARSAAEIVLGFHPNHGRFV